MGGVTANGAGANLRHEPEDEEASRDAAPLRSTSVGRTF